MGGTVRDLAPWVVFSAAVEEIKEKMKTVRHKILVLSGKGGVGKSTFSAHLAHGLAEDENTQVRPWERRGAPSVERVWDFVEDGSLR